MGYSRVRKLNFKNHSSYQVVTIIFERLSKPILETKYPFL